jgi:hypothetical protein
MLKEKIRKFLTGVAIKKEYPCVDHLQFNGEVKVLMHHNGEQVDITDDHLFLGYKPLIAGIHTVTDIDAPEVRISFIHRSGAKLAEVQLKKIAARVIGNTYLVLFTGIHADTFFLPLFNRSVNVMARRFRKKINGNVEMEGNEYQQVQAMYSIPRKISVISLGHGELFNMFPTDLHGNAGKDFYVDSLRKAGKACGQVLALKRVVKADIELSSKEDVFAMGKNHMKELQAAAGLPVQGFSDMYKLPLVKGTIAYKEMELYDHIEIGIHRVLVFRVHNEVILNSEAPVLSCTNGHYLQWRLDHSLHANYI